LRLDQLDVKTTFLYGYLNEEIFMSQPTGVQDYRKKEYGVLVEKVAL